MLKTSVFPQGDLCLGSFRTHGSLTLPIAATGLLRAFNRYYPETMVFLTFKTILRKVAK